jgi:predicted nucleic acid-binding Zn ribbon protein
MPIYTLECNGCGLVEDYILDFSELEKCRIEGSNLECGDLCKCAKCDSSSFSKKISAHGKTAVNWAKWNAYKK